MPLCHTPRSVPAFESLEPRTLLSTYYLSATTGNDGNAGTSSASPWRSIAKLNALDLNPGDSVFFEGGGTYNGTFTLTQEDLGTSAAPIAISSYGTGRATINGGNDDGIFAKYSAVICISNLRFVCSGLNPTTYNPSYVNFYHDLAGNVRKDFIRIDNIEATGFWEAGIRIEH